MGIFNLFCRPQEDTAAARKARLLRTGRVAEGSIFDVGTDETGAVTHIFTTTRSAALNTNPRKRSTTNNASD